MTQWFHERYISREEHQQIIEYYRNLVAQLQRTVCDLRTRVDAQAIDTLLEHSKMHKQRELQKSGPRLGKGNVIRIDFRSRS